VNGVLVCADETTAPSKLNSTNEVPAIAEIVRMPAVMAESVASDVHCTDVDEDHAAVAHAAAASSAVAVMSVVPKLRPVTVTEDPPD
jgi:uncharacterized Rossmann fold enzyme